MVNKPLAFQQMTLKDGTVLFLASRDMTDDEREKKKYSLMWKNYKEVTFPPGSKRIISAKKPVY